jgi:hypothetical protein
MAALFTRCRHHFEDERVLTMSPTEVRTRLAQNGYPAIPCRGKAPVLPKWQERTETSERDIDIWARTCPDAQNTGVVTTSVPALDLDILDETAVDAAVALVQERFGERGKVMLRYGRRPKVAVLFRTDAPFSKIQVPLTAPDGSAGQKIEFLGHGQQIIVDGFHPDTHALYEWRDGNPCSVRRDELPLITEAEAQALVSDIVAALSRDHGYQIVDEGKRKGNGADDSGGRVDWEQPRESIRTGREYHKSLCSLSYSLLKAGTNPGAAVNMLRDLMETSEAPRDKRWNDRYREIPKLVKDGLQRLQKDRQREEDAAIDAVAEHDGGPLLDDVRAYLGRFVCYPSEHAAVAHTLWIAHAHLMPAWDSTPRIAFLSAEPESGKSRCLDVTEPLVPRPINTMNSSANYLFRQTGSDAGQPTILFDEVDTIFGPKARDHEDIRAFVNSGHRRGAKFGRCVVRGTVVETEEIESYAAVALAGLGWLPATILSRSIIIRMRKHLRDQQVEPWRHRIHTPQGVVLCRRLIGWARRVADDAEKARPVMPPSVEDRQADCWEPLLVVADLAGGLWPTLARDAAEALVAVGRDTPVSLNLRLLGDLRTVFLNNLVAVAQATPHGLPTKKIMEDLYALDEAPWHTVNKGDAYTPSQLALTLRDYEVRSENLRPHPDARTQAKGYPVAPLADAWRRYLPPLDFPPGAVPNVTTVTKDVFERFFEVAVVTPVTPVTLVTPPEAKTVAVEPGGLPEQLDAERVKGLAGWWRGQIKQWQKKLSPALAKDQVRKLLREVLVEEIRESALDAEVRRIERAANKTKSAKGRSRR